MVSTASIIACIITLFICLLLPPALLLFYAQANKGANALTAWLLGAAGFFVTQILIRVPILALLQTQSWFIAFSQKHLLLYGFTLAFTAGLFELAGRFAVAKIMEKKLTYQRAFAAGLGHGGIEAMFLLGLTYISNLTFMFMINTGTFDVLGETLAAAGLDPAQLQPTKDALINTHPALYLLAGFERILAMTAHVGMSMIVSCGIARKKPLAAALVCLGIHTLLDLTTCISLAIGTVLSQAAAYLIIYSLLTLAAAASVVIVVKIRRQWNPQEVINNV